MQGTSGYRLRVGDYQMPSISIKRIAQLLGDTEKMVLEVYNHVLGEKENVQEVVSNAMAL